MYRKQILRVIQITALALFNLAPVLFAQTNAATLPAKQTPQVVQDGTARLAGHYNPTEMMRLVIALKPAHPEEEKQFLQDLQTKGSPQFHHYLTAKEWNERFGPSEADEKAVAEWAQSQGLTVTRRYPNRLLVDIEAPAGAIEKAFGITMNSYKLGTQAFRSNDRDPVLPADLANTVQSIGGLNNLHSLHPISKNRNEPAFSNYTPEIAGQEARSMFHDGSRARLRDVQEMKASGQGISPNVTNGAYDPVDLYSSEAYDANALYNLGHCCNPLNNPGGSPKETSIAIATAGTQDWNDMQGFVNQYPYLSWHAQQIYVDGTPSCCDEEGTMNLEWATAMSNSFGSYLDTATVYLYDGANSELATFNDIYNQILTDDKANIVMTGWGCAELSCYDANDMSTANNIFSQMTGEGWIMVAATGGQGATAGCSNADAVQYPASDPNMIAVGGTSLSLTNGQYTSEVGLTGGGNGCAGGDGGSGGGQSAYWPATSFQSSQPNPPTMRTVPDLALNADPDNNLQNFFFGGTLIGSGGTDFAAAEMAGFFAQSNAYLLYLQSINSHYAAPGAPLPVLYHGTMQPGFAHYPFYDIVSGCNNNDITAANNLPYFCAAPGYDMVTGWGSVNMLQFAWDINEQQNLDQAPPDITFSGPTKGHWYRDPQTNVSWTLVDTDTNIPSGIAGYSASWDSDPNDVPSEATPGSGNAFYSGPSAPNSTNGSYLLSDAGQGCHTLYVVGWSNLGFSQDVSGGPFCYDSIPPVTRASQSPAPDASGWNKTTVQISLAASDPGAGSTGSGVAATYYAVGNAACSSTNLGACKIYSAPFSITSQASHEVSFFSLDRAGNAGTLQSIPVRIDETAPSTAISFKGTKVGVSYKAPVQVTLTGTDALSGVASTVYQLDGGSQQTYGKPFSVSTVGSHTVTFHSTDKAGNVETTKSAKFTVTH